MFKPLVMPIFDHLCRSLRYFQTKIEPSYTNTVKVIILKLCQ